MSRPVLIGLGVWVAAIALLVVGGALGLWHNLPNIYLCGWLVLVSLPLGALPVLMILELANAGEAGVAASLRSILASLPILALLILPLLFDLHGAYTWQACFLPHCPPFHYEGFGTRWFKPGAFALRSVIYLVIWIGLSLYFLRPARPTPARRRLAAFGLMLHVVLGTLASYDWFMSLDEGHVSSNYGVLVMTLQGAFALSAALLMVLGIDRGVPTRRALLVLVVMAAIATFAQFVEFLVVWSANLPKEIVWYQDRARGGEIFSVAGPLLLLTGAVLIVPERFAANRILVALGTIAFLAVAVVDLILLSSPHDLFVVDLVPDLLAIVALGGFATACAFYLGGKGRRRMRHV